MISLGAAAAAGAVGAALLPRGEAQAHGTIHHDAADSAPAIHGNNASSGPGVLGTAQTGPGVIGESGSGPGVRGVSTTFHGVIGESNSGRGVFGSSQSGSAVVGESNTSPGVRGHSTSSAGVRGKSESGPGGSFVSNTGPALDVIGKAQFSTAGSGVIPAGQDSSPVGNSAVTASSHITVTLASNPGPRQLRWVERNPGVGFTVYLTETAPPGRPQTNFTYLIVEPTQ